MTTKSKNQMPKHLSSTTRCVSICLNICCTANHRPVEIYSCGSEVNSAPANTLCHIAVFGFLQKHNILLQNHGSKSGLVRSSNIRTVAKLISLVQQWRNCLNSLYIGASSMQNRDTDAAGARRRIDDLVSGAGCHVFSPDRFRLPILFLVNRLLVVCSSVCFVYLTWQSSGWIWINFLDADRIWINF